MRFYLTYQPSEIVKSFPANVKGILVLPGLPPEGKFINCGKIVSNWLCSGPFSPAAKYPNKQNGLYPNSTMIWNPHASIPHALEPLVRFIWLIDTIGQRMEL